MGIDVAHYEQMVKDLMFGRLEGEPPETAYYWEAYMNGDGEWLEFNDDATPYSVFDVSFEEAMAFDIGAPYFIMWVSESGFVYGVPFSQQEYDNAHS